MITAPTRDVLATSARPRVEQFLQERGLAFSEAKTRIVPLTDGFDFLGFPLRKFGKQGTVLTVPQKAKVLKPLRGIRAYLDAQKHTPCSAVMKALNPVIRGWAQYDRHVSAKDVLAKGGHTPWHMLWRWAKRRHPQKSCAWVKARSYGDQGYGVFREGQAALVRPERTPITRFSKVTGKHSPYDPTLRQYWQERKKRQVGRATSRTHRLMLHHRQGYRCALCRIPFGPGERRELEHIIPTHHGGTDDLDNTRLVHPWCHRQRQQKDGRPGRRA